MPNFNYLPRALCFDEFKATKDCDGYVSFIFCDAKNGRIIDVLSDRKLHKLKEYFYQFPLKVLKKIKHITIDMYKTYILLIRDLFPNAKISIDIFHLIQLINRSFNKIRIQITNKCKNQDERFYRKLKYYWKLLLKIFKKLILYIKNSLKYSFSNGILEGINCKIKVLKRGAYGYKSFFYFRNRILIQGNILTVK